MYALMSEGPDIRKFGEGSVHTTIYFPEIRAFHVRLAPMKEQAEIVRSIRATFRRIDQLVEAARGAAARVETLLRSIVALAFAGRLTSREEGDGSAVEELERVRLPAPEMDTPADTDTKSRSVKVTMRSVEEVLREAEDWLPAQEVFKRCGVGNGADTELLEQIFAELRTLDRMRLLLAKPMLNKSGRKVQDSLRLVR